jgi:hypothetical protein
VNRDTEQLSLLAIFHYVVAGLAALFFFPRYFMQQSASSSYLLRGTERRNQVKNCRPSFSVGFLRC